MAQKIETQRQKKRLKIAVLTVRAKAVAIVAVSCTAEDAYEQGQKNRPFCSRRELGQEPDGGGLIQQQVQAKRLSGEKCRYASWPSN